MTNLDNSEINNLQQDNEVESRARAIFKTACESADSYHTLRLGMARRKALNAGAAHVMARVWAPLASGAVACCALVVGVTLLRPVSHTASPAGVATMTPATTEQAEVIDELPEVDSSQMDMVQDLDFYRWLASQPAVASTQTRDGR